MKKQIRILGTRGIPAAHGGFETFAERLALYLAPRGWDVTVYCQEAGRGPIHEDLWHGVRRIAVPVTGSGPAATMLFDWKATWHAAFRPGLCLTLGYNTAAFCLLLRLRHRTNVINMDGLEWQRAKWGVLARNWLWLNERAGLWVGDHLIADHPEIARHLQQSVNASKVTMLPYGAARIDGASLEPLTGLGLEPGRFLTLIARPEPENSVLEIVRAFSARPRACVLAVLGQYSQTDAYQRRVLAAAGPEVRFLGAIYDARAVGALRFFSKVYVHGHQVGGTNPSLVEALGAGNAVIAHDNRFNRWVAADAARYFQNETQAAALFDDLLVDEPSLEAMRAHARIRHDASFTWDAILRGYEDLLTRHL